MYIVNLSVSGIIMTLFCVPPTFLQVLYGGWWHLGVVACKLVPLMQGDQKKMHAKYVLPALPRALFPNDAVFYTDPGANILVSAFTITVIAIDRWKSVSNTNPNASLTYKSVFAVIAVLWILSFGCKLHRQAGDRNNLERKINFQTVRSGIISK